MSKARDIDFDNIEFPIALYKYRDWKDSFHRSVITKRQLYYAAPSQFNDVNDCKIPIRFDLLSKEERIKCIEHDIRRREPKKAKSYYWHKAKEIFKNSALKNNNDIHQQQKVVFELYDVRTGVLSLTQNPHNDRMWNEYSSQHSGFCVGFHGKELFRHLKSGGTVGYAPSLPILYPEPKMSIHKIINARIFVKEDKWAFEEEYRTHIFDEHPLNSTNRILTVNPEAFKEIIIGKNMLDHDKLELLKSIPDELKHVEIIYAK